jgi:hypothetical protein
MKRQILSSVMLMAGVGMVIAGPPKDGLAADKMDYSGKYSAERLKNTPLGSSDSTLEVVQNEDSIEITRVELGKRTTSRCPFNGSEGEYTSPGGFSGKCKAQLKGKHLIIESVVVARPQPTSAVRMHTKEQWQLSTDGKTLTIKLDVDFPDFPAGVTAAVAGSTSTTLKYKRTENP